VRPRAASARLHDQGLPMAQRHEILCATAQWVWRAAPGAGLPTGEEKARSLGEWIAHAGVIERVSTGLLGTKVGLQPVAGQMLQVADRVAQGV
jgi:hypothetical protein